MERTIKNDRKNRLSRLFILILQSDNGSEHLSAPLPLMLQTMDGKTRKRVNAILIVLVIGLAYICVASIMGPINFDKERSARESVVKARLIQIRQAQLQYKIQHGKYCGTFAELIIFIDKATMKNVVKEGELTEAQMDSGMTEAKAEAIVKSGDAALIARNGLQKFRRDTMEVKLKETLFGKNFHADSIQYIPFSNGEKFELQVATHLTASGVVEYMMQCGASYCQYLKGLDENEIANLTDMMMKEGQYAGLKIGDILTPNNNAGNWE